MGASGARMHIKARVALPTCLHTSPPTHLLAPRYGLFLQQLGVQIVGLGHSYSFSSSAPEGVLRSVDLVRADQHSKLAAPGWFSGAL